MRHRQAVTDWAAIVLHIQRVFAEVDRLRELADDVRDRIESIGELVRRRASELPKPGSSGAMR